MALLEVENLCVEFATRGRPLPAVDGVSLQVEEGEVVGIVGESGSGKSVTSLAVMGLIEAPGRVRADRIAFAGHDLEKMGARRRRRLIGRDLAMVFQEPATSLNPCFTVGYQIDEVLRVHTGGNRPHRRGRVLELLTAVGIPDAKRHLNAFPHQLSGGMNQRVMIAMAIACRPRLLIADEPTTALDVTIQAQILELLLRLQRERAMALVLITHDLAVVAETAQRVVVMYAGQVVETSPVARLFSAPRHPYTAALLASLPGLARGGGHLAAIPGIVPPLDDLPQGCRFHPRCAYATGRCGAEAPVLLVQGERAVRCHFPLSAKGGAS